MTATVSLWLGPWATDHLAVHGHAGGYGYDKVSAAIADAARGFPEGNHIRWKLCQTDGRGISAVRRTFEDAGYQVVEVIS